MFTLSFFLLERFRLNSSPTSIGDEELYNQEKMTDQVLFTRLFSHTE